MVLPRPAEHAEWRRLQRKNLSILGLPKWKEWSQCHRESSSQVCRSRPCQKEKEQSCLSRVPDHERGESQDDREPNLSESMERKGWTPQLRKADSKEERETSKKSLSRTSRRKHERVSGRKSSPGRSAESWFHSKSGQT